MKPIFAALLLAPLAAHAATPAIPDAGSILQQIKPAKPQPPSSQGRGVVIEKPRSAPAPASGVFEVKRIVIVGNSVIDTPTLHALVAEAEEKHLDLSQLEALAARITDYYQEHGYPLARAIIPAQTIKEGVVNFQVVEARYSLIVIDNKSEVGGSLLKETLATLRPGEVIDERRMDHALLLLSDIPGVSSKAILRPGAEVGTSELQVEAAATPSMSGNITADNYGSLFTGKGRVSGTINFINLAHHGDVLSANVLTAGRDMDYARLGYDTLTNGQGTRAGAAFSAVRYAVGKSLAPLRANGMAQVGSFWVKQPLVRSRDFNIYGEFEYDQKILHDRIQTGDIRTDRHLTNGLATLNGDLRDGILGGGINTASVSGTHGQKSFDDLTAQSGDMATAQSEGRFTKWSANLSRLQAITASTTLYVAATGQWSNNNLDSSEKLSVGGPYTVRAYDMGAVSGDGGYTATLELRHDFGAGAYGAWQPVLFVDTANVTINRKPWAEGINSATLNGAGIGVNWFGFEKWRVKASVAARYGKKSSLIEDNSTKRGWVEITRAL